MSISNAFEESRIAIDEHHVTESSTNSDSTRNATIFRSWEAPVGYRHGGRIESFKDWYKRLWGYHTGLYTGWWEDASKQNRLSKWYLLNMISSQLEMTPFQRSEAERLLETEVTDMRAYNSSHSNDSPTETVILALCAFICHKDGRKCHPNHEDSDELFEALKESIKIRQCYFDTVYGRLEQDLL